MMDRYFQLVLGIPKTTIGFLVTVTLIFAYGATRLEFDNSIEALLPQNDAEYLYYEKTKEVFGDNDRYLVALISRDQLWHRETFRLINDLVEDLEEYLHFNGARERQRMETLKTLAASAPLDCGHLMEAFSGDGPGLRALKRHLGAPFEPGVRLSGKRMQKLIRSFEKDLAFKRGELLDKIVSPINVKDISGRNDTLIAYDLIPEDSDGRRVLPATADDFAAFRRMLNHNPAFENVIYAQDPHSGAITDFGLWVTFDNLQNQDPIARHICRLIESHKQLNVTIQGMPYANIVFNDYMRRDLARFLPFVTVAVVLVLLANFRSARGVVLPFVTLSMSAIWILGLMGFLGIRITAVGISLPPLMVAVGSSYSIHILNQYYIESQTIVRKGRREGLAGAMTHISFTVLLAGLTTFVAFISFYTNQVSAIREWGIFCGLGVIFSVFISFTLLPVWLSLLPPRVPAFMDKGAAVNHAGVIDRFVTRVADGAVKHAKVVLAIVFLVLAVSLVGILRLKVESDFVQHFREDDPIRVSADIIEEKLSGRWGFNLLIDSGAVDGVKTRKFLNTVESVRQWLTSDHNRDLNIGRVDAFSDVIKSMHMAMHNDDPAFYAIPESEGDILDYLELYAGDDKNGDGRFDEFEPYVDGDFRTVNLMARFVRKEDYALGTSQVKRILSAVNAYMERSLPAPYTHHITGLPVLNVQMADYIVAGQVQSLLFSFVFILLIVLLLFRNMKAVPLVLIPMSVAVLISFGIMGWFRINLDIVTSIIAAITVGIGVDDTIHVPNTYRHFRRDGSGIAHTVENVLRVSGRAIIYTSLALIAGFSVLAVSSFKPVVLFGMLMAITMMATTLGALLVLPAVLRLTRVDLSPWQSGS